MKAAFLDKPRAMSVREVPEPDCGPDQVLVRVRAVGICGSDLHYYLEGRIGDHVVREPHILGHECSGEVAEVGASVRGIRPGDRVAVEPGVPCFSCPRCLEGRYNLCDGVRFLGAPPHPGAFRELLAQDARFVFKLPGSVSFTQGALAEPLAVAHNALRKLRLEPGASVLVVGMGPIGFSCLEMVALAGAARIIACETQPHRREAAGRLGATEAIDPGRRDALDQVREITGGRLCDCAIEASGTETGVGIAVRGVRRGGRIAFIGMGPEQFAIPYAELLKKEAEVHGIYRYANNYAPVLQLLGAGRLRGEPWVSHRFVLEELPRAMEMAADPEVEKLKMILTME